MQPRRRRTSRKATETIFGETLREIRKERGLSQETLAFESGYHPTYIGQLERGAKNPSLRTMLALADVLKITLSDFVKRFELRRGEA